MNVYSNDILGITLMPSRVKMKIKPSFDLTLSQKMNLKLKVQKKISKFEFQIFHFCLFNYLFIF